MIFHAFREPMGGLSARISAQWRQAAATVLPLPNGEPALIQQNVYKPPNARRRGPAPIPERAALRLETGRIALQGSPFRNAKRPPSQRAGRQAFAPRWRNGGKFFTKLAPPPSPMRQKSNRREVHCWHLAAAVAISQRQIIPCPARRWPLSSRAARPCRPSVSAPCGSSRRQGWCLSCSWR